MALLLSFLITGIYSLIRFLPIRVCLFDSDTPDCPSVYASVSFKNDFQNSNLGLLCLINVCVLIVAKYGFFYFVWQKHKKDLVNFVSPRNFTLLCKIKSEVFQGHDYAVKLDDLIANIINNNANYRESELVTTYKINPIYDIKELLQVTSELMKVEKRLKMIEKGIDLGKYTRAQKQAEVNSLDGEKKTLRQKQNEIIAQAMRPEGLKFTGWVFISFSTVQDLLKVKARNNSSLQTMKLGLGSPWRSVPEPADIIWENWAVSQTRKTVIRTANFLIACLIIAINFGIILGFKYLQAKVSDWMGNDRTTSLLVAEIVVSVAISIVIGVVNFLIRLVLIWLTQFEYYKTHTTLFAEVVFKVVLLQFVNKALIVLLTNKIIHPDQDWQIFGSSSVIGNMVVAMIINVVFDVFVYLVEPRYMIKLWRRYKIRKAGSAIRDQVFQVEANEAFEGIKFDVSEAYFLSFSTLCVAFFYQAIIPYGLLMGLVELVLKYFIVKYVLIKRSVKPQDLEFEFTRKMFHQFEFCVFLLSLGYVVFYVIFRTDGASLNGFFAVSLGLAGADWLIISRLINLWTFKQHDENCKGTFESQELNFPMDYDRQNPATQRNAFVKFLKKLQCREDFLPVDTPTPATADRAEGVDLRENIENYAINGEHGPGVTFDGGTSALYDFVRRQRNPRVTATPDPYQFQAMMQAPFMRSFMDSIRPSVRHLPDLQRASEETVEYQTPVRPYFARQYEQELLRQSVMFGRSNRILTDSIANFNPRSSSQMPLIRVDPNLDEPLTPLPNRVLKDDHQLDSPTLDNPHLETHPNQADEEQLLPPRPPNTTPSLASNISPSIRSVNVTTHPQFGRIQTSFVMSRANLNDQTGPPVDFSERHLASATDGMRVRGVTWGPELTPVHPPRNPETPDATPGTENLVLAFTRQSQPPGGQN